MKNIVDTINPNTERIIMVVNAYDQWCVQHRYLNQELNDIFGPDVVDLINKGERAIFHTERDKNLVAFDVTMAAVKANIDLFEKFLY